MWAKLLESALKAIVGAMAKGVISMAPSVAQRIRNWWQGKSVAIIGPTASGKNSLFQKLKREKAPSIHIQTRGAEKIENFKFSWPLPDKTKVEFHCKGSINVGGEIDERDRFWSQSCEQADVIFYLVDAEKLFLNSEDAINRYRSDLHWLMSNISKFKHESNIHILINKVDKFVEGVAPDAIQEVVHQKLGQHVEAIESITKKTLGHYYARISGISPISMTDDYIFNVYFVNALKAVAESREAKK